MRILTVNCGSSSLKVDIGDVDLGKFARVASILVEDDASGVSATIELRGERTATHRTERGLRAASELAIRLLEERMLLQAVAACGHRIVHGGPDLAAPVLVDEAMLSKLEAATELAPLHNGPAIEALRAFRAALPGVAMVASFDTAYFRDLPPVAATYALPASLMSRLGIRRYGFHGFAHRYMAQRFAELSGPARLRVVTLQLGGGCSAAAISAGRPLDVSMGFTPLEGLVMASRSGDLDPALPAYLAGHAGMSLEEVETMLNYEAGLLGLSGLSGDVRQLLAAEAQGHEGAGLALELFCYRVRKYIGAYAGALGGLDGVVFGGGIGENSPDVRRRICIGLEWLGLELDASRNERGAADSSISADGSRVMACIVKVDEAALIAVDAAGCLTEEGGGGR